VKKPLRRAEQLALLGESDGVLGVGEAAITASFHLDENYRLAIPCNEVQLADGRSVPAGENSQPGPTQKTLGELLAFQAQLATFARHGTRRNCSIAA